MIVLIRVVMVLHNTGVNQPTTLFSWPIELLKKHKHIRHYRDVIMGAMASQITCVSIVYSTSWSGVDQGIHQSSASLAFVRGIHRSPVNSPHKGPVTRKMFPFDDVMIKFLLQHYSVQHPWFRLPWFTPESSARHFRTEDIHEYSWRGGFYYKT